MQRNLIIILYILLSEILVGQNISKIKLVYGSEGTLIPVSASCTPESFSFSFGDDINFLTTYDKSFLESFADLSKDLMLIENNDLMFSIDPRIMVIITYEESIPSDTICFGEFYGICLNGKLMQNNDKLLNLVKKKIGWNCEKGK